METNTIVEKLIANGWTLNVISELADNKLNKGVKAYLTYGNKHSFRYYPEEKFFRLMIYGHNDERCLQIAYENKLDTVINKIISMKDELSLDNYLMQYITIQTICPVSILTVEQFL